MAAAFERRVRVSLEDIEFAVLQCQRDGCGGQAQFALGGMEVQERDEVKCPHCQQSLANQSDRHPNDMLELRAIRALMELRQSQDTRKARLSLEASVDTN